MRRIYPIWVALMLLALLGVGAQPGQAQETYRILLPFVSAAPPTVHVLSYSAARFSDGTLYVAGEVLNELPETVYLVYVTVRAYDDAGQQVATASKHVLLVHTPNGARSPFRVGLPATPAAIDHYDISLGWSTENRSSFRTLTLLNEQILATSGGLEVRGSVRNDDKKSIREGRVAITFYDAAGQVVDATYATIGAQRITSGSSATYIIAIDHPIAYSRYEIRAEGSIAPEG